MLRITQLVLGEDFYFFYAFDFDFDFDFDFLLLNSIVQNH